MENLRQLSYEDRDTQVACHTGSPRRGQGGNATLKTLLWLVILVAGIYTGIKVVPVLVAEYQFQDFMQSTARFASVNRNQTPADITKSVMEEAEKQNIPLQAEDVHVTAESGNINISADYSVTIDLNLYQWTLNFHPSAGNKALT
jgi:Flp pilus assembly protein TadG